MSDFTLSPVENAMAGEGISHERESLWTNR